MISSIEPKSPQQLSWEQRLLKNPVKSKGPVKPEYQELKFTLHRKLPRDNFQSLELVVSGNFQ